MGLQLTTKVRLWWAGWRPRRDVWGQLKLPISPPMFPEAKRVLSRYGGLRFGNSDEHLALEPVRAMEDDEGLLARCELALGRRLYPLGYQVHQDPEVIFIDERGALFKTSGDELYSVAETFEEALWCIVRPGQAGLNWRPGSNGLGSKPWWVGDAAPAPGHR